MCGLIFVVGSTSGVLGIWVTTFFHLVSVWVQSWESCVCVVGVKSKLYKVGVGDKIPIKGVLSPLLLVISMDRT